MNIFNKRKDGGESSPVDAYFLIEVKGLFTIALLKFNKGQREAFHTHAFNAWTWFLKGNMRESRFNTTFSTVYTRSIFPKFTSRYNNHRVIAEEDSWCITLRGPWQKTWTEHKQVTTRKGVRRFKVTTFGHGRNILGETYDYVFGNN